MQKMFKLQAPFGAYVDGHGQLPDSLQLRLSCCAPSALPPKKILLRKQDSEL
jgi:hypothetical protein